jgi:hypothetical protein
MTEQERKIEIERLTEWIADMEDMLANDGTVPVWMIPMYERQLATGYVRLNALTEGDDE